MKYFSDEDVLGQFYLALAAGNEKVLHHVHIPRSEVFYVREALHQKTGIRYTLDYVEWALLKEKMISPRDCFEPELKKSWDEYPLEKELKRCLLP